MQNKYDIVSVLGEGSFGVVYKGYDKETKETVAIKKYKEGLTELTNKSIAREIKAFNVIQNKNVVNCRESFMKKGCNYLVLDYVERDLLHVLKENPNGVEEHLIKKIIYQLCDGLRHIHKCNFIHRDIKPENILISKNNEVKICDFGFSREQNKNEKEDYTDYIATRWYRAPELILSESKYGNEVDFWSVGCIMGELIDGNPVFPAENDQELIYMIKKSLRKHKRFSLKQFEKTTSKKIDLRKELEVQSFLNPANNMEINIKCDLATRYAGKISADGISFLEGLLDPNPKYRLKGDALFSHPYLSSFGYDSSKHRRFITPRDNVVCITKKSFTESFFTQPLALKDQTKGNDSNEFRIKLSRKIFGSPVNLNKQQKIPDKAHSDNNIISLNINDINASTSEHFHGSLTMKRTTGNEVTDPYGLSAFKNYKIAQSPKATNSNNFFTQDSRQVKSKFNYMYPKSNENEKPEKKGKTNDINNKNNENKNINMQLETKTKLRLPRIDIENKRKLSLKLPIISRKCK